jgi:tetratricopeptide (TPR) repeat protein
MGREDDALAIYAKALELAPKHPEAAAARNNLGAMRLARGEKDAALEHFEAALAAAPANLESRYNAALLYLEKGRNDEAIALLEQAAQLEPNHEPVNLRLGLAYLDAQRDDDAYRSLLLVRRSYPQNWAAALGLAVLHARAEQPEPARYASRYRGLEVAGRSQGGARRDVELDRREVAAVCRNRRGNDAGLGLRDEGRQSLVDADGIIRRTRVVPQQHEDRVRRAVGLDIVGSRPLCRNSEKREYRKRV